MKLLKIELQKWFVCHWYCWIHHRYEEFLAFILLFLYSTWFLFMCKHNTCQIWWWFLNFVVAILKHECWFCPDLGGVLLCLELETGCKKNGSRKPPIILGLIFAVSCSVQVLPLPVSDPVCFPWGCRCRVPSQQAACSTSLFAGSAWHSVRLCPCPTWQRLCQAWSSWLNDGSYTAQGGVQESVEQIWAVQVKIPCACMFTDKVIKIWLWL